MSFWTWKKDETDLLSAIRLSLIDLKGTVANLTKVQSTLTQEVNQMDANLQAAIDRISKDVTDGIADIKTLLTELAAATALHDQTGVAAATEKLNAAAQSLEDAMKPLATVVDGGEPTTTEATAAQAEETTTVAPETPATADVPESPASPAAPAT